jgi:hypothetical protein
VYVCVRRLGIRGADFYVCIPFYHIDIEDIPYDSPRRGAGLTFANVMGFGLASGTLTHASWDSAYNTSSGALILAGHDGLGGFGKFAGVLVALSLIANSIPEHAQPPWASK